MPPPEQAPGELPLDRPELPAGARLEGPDAWPAWTAPLALLTGLSMALFAGIVVAVVATAFGADIDEEPPAVLIVATALQTVAFVAAAVLFARVAGGTPRPRDLGITPVRFASGLGWLVVTWLAFIVFSAVWTEGLGIDAEEDLPDELGADESAVALAAVAVLVCVLAPIGEEVLFRGFIFRALRNWRGALPSALITGAMFGAVHAVSSPAEFLVPLAFFGAGLCLLYHRTGSLYPCMALHALNNSLALGITQGWDWQIPVVMAGSLAVIAAIVAPVAARGRRAAE